VCKTAYLPKSDTGVWILNDWNSAVWRLGRLKFLLLQVREIPNLVLVWKLELLEEKGDFLQGVRSRLGSIGRCTCPWVWSL